MDLLLALKLTFDSTLYDFNKTATTTDGVLSKVVTEVGSSSLVIPSITYALSLDSDASSYSFVE